nr:DUF418 domain-containing protein [Bacillus sp. FJAT-47783]
MFLLGAAFSKLKIFYDVKKHNILIKRIWWMGLLVGLPLNSLAAYETSFLMIGAPFLMLFYVMSMTLCMQRPTWQNRCKKVAAVGRTAFSNYILQSIVCTLLFYSYGLGLYGKVNPFVGLWISVAIFAMQMAVSTWWLKKYRMGPLEWVWRTMTYGRVQRLKRVEEMN